MSPLPWLVLALAECNNCVVAIALNWCEGALFEHERSPIQDIAIGHLKGH